MRFVPGPFRVPGGPEYAMAKRTRCGALSVLRRAGTSVAVWRRMRAHEAPRNVTAASRVGSRCDVRGDDGDGSGGEGMDGGPSFSAMDSTCRSFRVWISLSHYS